MAFVKIENGVVVQKQYRDADGFIEAPDNVVCGFLFDGEDFSAPPIPKKPYDVLREAAYPPMADYIDAKVKQASSDPAIVAEGEAQEAAYLAACLAVKAQFPKPE